MRPSFPSPFYHLAHTLSLFGGKYLQLFQQFNFSAQLLSPEKKSLHLVMGFSLILSGLLFEMIIFFNTEFIFYCYSSSYSLDLFFACFSGLCFSFSWFV
jgi:hypothetical protein